MIPYLDELSNEAEKTQAVNTIYLKNKKVYGHNTDIEGFEYAIRKTYFDFVYNKILILGGEG